MSVDFLAEQGLVEEVSTAALKRVISWQIAEAMKLETERISKESAEYISSELEYP